MKKIFLLAAFGVAGLISAKGAVENKFESNKIRVVKKVEKSPTQTCGVVVTYYSGGQVVGSQTLTSEQPTLESCKKWQNGVRFALQIAGFWTV
ncbi:hypothetical protein [Chryseobacterium sp. GP-SGM7]|uniref:hypothetical protein n=1 Tax=Chryseobacterium sp. GP-SGM7 TaxID=3411323 RepID=UPI003B95200C